MKTILFALIPLSTFAQQTVNPTAITLNADGQYAVNVFMSNGSWQQPSAAQPVIVATTLGSSATNVATTLTLASGAGIGNNDLLLIDGGTVNAEMVTVASKTGNQVTVTRALVPVYCGGSTQPYTLCSTAVAHANGASVQQLRTKSNGGGTAVQNVYNQFGKQLVMDALKGVIQNVGHSPSASAAVAALNTDTAAIQAAKDAAAQ